MVPESRDWRALGEDKCNANNADNKEGGDNRVPNSGLMFIILYCTQHQFDDGDFAKACTPNMESLRDPS